MEYHKFLHDENELNKFLSKLREIYTFQKDEVGYLMLMSRNKYLNEEERSQVDLGRANIVTRQILHSFETKDVVQALYKMECAYGAYTDRSGNPIPNECLIPYLTYNPVSPIKAFADTQRCFVDYIMELDNRTGDKENTYNRLSKIDSQYRSQLQRAFSRKILLDFDFDIPDRDFGNELTDHFLATLEIMGGKGFKVMTRSGFHVLVEKSSLKYNYNMDLLQIQKMASDRYCPDNILPEGMDRAPYEIAKNENEGIPLPGTMQKDHLVRVIL